MLVATIFLAIIEGYVLEEFKLCQEVSTDAADTKLHLIIFNIVSKHWVRKKLMKIEK